MKQGLPTATELGKDDGLALFSMSRGPHGPDAPYGYHFWDALPPTFWHTCGCTGSGLDLHQFAQALQIAGPPFSWGWARDWREDFDDTEQSELSLAWMQAQLTDFITVRRLGVDCAVDVVGVRDLQEVLWASLDWSG